MKNKSKIKRKGKIKNENKMKNENEILKPHNHSVRIGSVLDLYF